MNKRAQRSDKADAFRTANKKFVLSGDEVKTRLHERGETLKSWAAKHNFEYQTVSDVVRGKNKASYGLGHRIAIALGMKQVTA